jgi:hypothetical protein
LQLSQALNPQEQNPRFQTATTYFLWNTEHVHTMVEHVLGSPKVNAFSAVSSCKVCGLFFFEEPNATDLNYLDVLQQCVMPNYREMARASTKRNVATLPFKCKSTTQ